MLTGMNNVYLCYNNNFNSFLVVMKWSAMQHCPEQQVVQETGTLRC